MAHVRGRVLRIMQGLLVLLLAMAFVCGPLASDVPWHAYFASPDPYRYVRLQSTLFFGWFDRLPGVFTDHPMPQVDGSISTLRHEAECNRRVFLLGIGGLLRKEVTPALSVAATRTSIAARCPWQARCSIQPLTLTLT